MQEQNVPSQGNPVTQTSQEPQYFYARRVTALGMSCSALGLVVLTWIYFTQPAMGMLEKAAFVFFIAIFIINALQHLRPYVVIGADYIQLHSRKIPLDAVSRYSSEEKEKYFSIQFKEIQAGDLQPVETAVAVRLNMVKPEEQNKLLFALREAMLKTQAHKAQ